MSTERPAFKQAKDIEVGDWLDFGTRFYWQAGTPVELESGRIWVPLGYSGTELAPGERIRIHYPDTEETPGA